MAAPEGTSPSQPTTETETETLESKMDTTLDSNVAQETPASNDNDGEEGSGKTLEEAAELMEKGSAAIKDGDYAEAAECFSRAVEIRVGHYGELAPECSSAYYKYGCALLYKAQEEADPLGSMPKKDAGTVQSSEKNGSASKGESSASSAVDDANQDEDSTRTEGDPNDEMKGANEMDQTAADDEDADEGSEDEDESDLDLAWKMLDLARAIVEKNSEDTLEKVDILSALGEVALEREDIETSLSDYSSALSIVQRLVEADSRRIAELNFRICVVLEVSSKPGEAIPYCQQAISVCRSRVQRLKDEVNNLTSSAPTVVANGDQKVDQGPDVSDKEAEIETLGGLLSDLEKKLEDLQQLVSQPNTYVADFLKMIAAKSAGNGTSSASASAFDSSQLGTNNSGGGFDSPTLSTAHTKGSGDGAAAVQHLGVVGRGVKRVSTSSNSVESVSVKKPSVEKGKDVAP